MNRSSVALSILLLVSGGACVDLGKVDLGPRFIDDFEKGLTPNWNRLSPWTCDDFTTGGGPDAGSADAGADAGDAGRPIADTSVASTCKLALETPGDDDKQALKSTFTLDDPPDGVRQFPVTEIVSHTADGTVDVTGFTQFVFSAILETAAPPLPSGTQFLIELGCSTFPSDPLATQSVAYTLGAGWTELRLKMSDFMLRNTSRNQSCLALLDSIHFVVKPPLADGAWTGGTLHIDNISLQN